MKQTARTAFFLLLVASSLLNVRGVGAELQWEAVSDSGGIKVFKSEIPGTSLIAFKGEGEIDAPVLRVGSVILDHTRISQWVDHVEKVEILQRISDTERIEYTHIGTPFVLKDRDFVVNARFDANSATGGVNFEFHSVEHPAAPVEGYVRGNLIRSSFVLKPIDGGKRTLFTGEIQADPKGSVPKWIVNLFQKNWPRKTLEALRRQVRRSEMVDSRVLADRLGARSK